MFGMLFDILKKNSAKEKDIEMKKAEDVIESKDNTSSDFSISGDFDNSNSSVDEDSTEPLNTDESNEIVKEDKEKQKKERPKKEKPNKKRRKKIINSFYSLGVYILFVITVIFSTSLLLSPNSYNLEATININYDTGLYEITYGIDSLWNDMGFSVGDTVCTPPYYNRDNYAIKEATTNCIKGKVVEAGYRVTVDYGFPKEITYQELQLYLDKDTVSSSKNISKIRVELKYLFGKYQITKIKVL